MLSGETSSGSVTLFISYTLILCVITSHLDEFTFMCSRSSVDRAFVS